MKFLDCYKEWMKTGRLPEGGLCFSLPKELIESEAWSVVKPARIDRDNIWSLYWGYEYRYPDPEFTAWGKLYAFTPLRQTLILLAAAINGELD